jgi:hypothetical protein
MSKSLLSLVLLATLVLVIPPTAISRTALQTTASSASGARFQSEPADFDLVWSAVDDNGIPLNPEWWWWHAHHTLLPNPVSSCEDFPLSPPIPGVGRPTLGSPPCSTQRVAFDPPAGPWSSFWCRLGAIRDGRATKFDGHANWAPATYTGALYWGQHSPPVVDDDDYSLHLVPPDITTLVPGNHGSIEIEFNSKETIDHFHTGWWETFHDAVDDGDPTMYVNGSDAVVTGLLGIDTQHGGHTELHPVWALAVHDRYQQSPTDDVWAIFVRNWGDEGFCSSHQWWLNAQTITLRLPWREGASSVSVGQANFLFGPDSLPDSYKQMVTGPGVTPLPNNQGVLVTFTLPPARAGARINGELHLQWAGFPADRCAAIRSRLQTLQVELNALLSDLPSNKVDIPGVLEQRDRLIARWHRQHDAEVKDLARRLRDCASASFKPPGALAISLPREPRNTFSETGLASGWKKMTRAERKALVAYLPSKLSPSLDTLSPPPGAALVPGPPPLPAAVPVPTTTARTDTNRRQLERRRWKALQRATHKRKGALH